MTERHKDVARFASRDGWSTVCVAGDEIQRSVTGLTVAPTRCAAAEFHQFPLQEAGCLSMAAFSKPLAGQGHGPEAHVLAALRTYARASPARDSQRMRR